MKRRTFISSSIALILSIYRDQVFATKSENNRRALANLGHIFLESANPCETYRIRSIAHSLDANITLESAATIISAQHKVGQTLKLQGFVLSEFELAIMVKAAEPSTAYKLL
jgi:hypothetical protein